MRSSTVSGLACVAFRVAMVVLGCGLVTMVTGTRYTNCGGLLEEPKGVIHSPNFPHQFPTPVLCEWVIHAPPGKKVMIYFTQYYLKGHFHVYEYDYYLNRGTPYAGENKLATVNYEDNIWGVAGHKPYLVLRFSVQDMGNIHMRVLDHFMDVYGFNITYEFVDRQSNITKNTCYVQSCSFLGNCLASADFSVYQCECFKGYFGDLCQFGPHCDPLNDINMCKNGGKCRYFYGTYVNYCECTDGYSGTKCEESGDVMSEACKALHCEQMCVSDTCTCIDGFRLTEDNVTCIHIDRYRVTVSVHPASDVVAMWMTSSLDIITNELEEGMFYDLFKKLWNQGMDTMSTFGILGFRNVTDGIEFQFYFYIEEYEKPKLSPILHGTMTTGNIGPITLLDTYIKLTIDPELYIARVVGRIEGYDVHPVVQGNDLVLSCEARGSKHIRFRWFKDDALFVPQLSVREAYQTTIPSVTEEIIRSVLRIDTVSPYDKGKFTCEATDYGEVQNKSIGFDVITRPLVDLDPLSTSVLPGSNVTIRCMSPDDTQNTFRYEWFEKGFKILSRQPGKRVEELKPTGIRLFVRNIQQGAVFTCRVTNDAGSVNVTAHVYVWPANETSLFCKKEYAGDVEWSRTGNGHFDKQRCPAEPTESGGYATRTCTCDQSATTCVWNTPNFAGCQSLSLVHIYDRFAMLRLGYQLASVTALYNDLDDFIAMHQDSLYCGDVEMAASLLLEILRLIRNFPVLIENDEQISALSIVNLLDALLSETSEASTEELQVLQAGNTFIRITDLLASRLIDHLDFDIHIPICTPLIEINIRKLSIEIDGNPSTTQLEIASIRSTYGGTGTRDTRGIMPFSEYVQNPADVMLVRYAYLESLLREKTTHSSISTKLAISDVYSVYPFPNDRFTDQKLYTEVTIFHHNQSHTRSQNDTICLRWLFDQRYQDRGMWVKDACTVMQTSLKSTVCRCRIPGHFLVVALEKNITIIPVAEKDTSGIFLLLGCIVMVCGVAATLSIYLLKWRQLIGGEYVINLNFLISLLSLTCVFLMCLYKRDVLIVCYVCRIMAYFFYLASFSFLFAESIYFFFNTYRGDRSGVNKHIYLLVGWGIPFILTGLFVMASEVFGRNVNCLLMCWLSREDWQFYAFIIPLICLVLGYMICMAASLKLCLSTKQEWRFNKRKKLGLRYGKSFSLLLLLLGISLLSIDLHGDDQLGTIIVIFIFKILIALFVFVHRGILDRQLLIVFWRMNSKLRRKRQACNNISMDEKPSNNGFRMFIKPEKIGQEIPSKEQESVNKYYAEVNRLKFTKERKQQLSSMLGSSSVCKTRSYVGAGYCRGDRENGAEDKRGGKSNAIYLGSDNCKYLASNSSDITPSAPISSSKTRFLTRASIHTDIYKDKDAMCDDDMPSYTDHIDRRFVLDLHPLPYIKHRAGHSNGFAGTNQPLMKHKAFISSDVHEEEDIHLLPPGNALDEKDGEHF